MFVTHSPNGDRTTEEFVVQFARPMAPDNWLTVSDAGPFDTAQEAWRWIDDNPLAFETRVARRVTHTTIEALSR